MVSSLLMLVPPAPRACHEALSALEIPNDLLQVIQDLLLDLRVHCLMVTLLHTTDGERGLLRAERIDRDCIVDWPEFIFITNSSALRKHPK